ncbi:hypothetical protein FXO38_05308 [Capsicum annuum]|nr:hypothetical protein FXO38_05308 [Capsicum annuum]
MGEELVLEVQWYGDVVLKDEFPSFYRFSCQREAAVHTSGVQGEESFWEWGLGGIFKIERLMSLIVFCIILDVIVLVSQVSFHPKRHTCSVTDNFQATEICTEAKETCYNWFCKVGSIRELLPRIYLELAIFHCWRYLLEQPADNLPRLVMMARGIADPLASFYCRLYLAHCAQKIDQRDIVLAIGDPALGIDHTNRKFPLLDYDKISQLHLFMKNPKAIRHHSLREQLSVGRSYIDYKQCCERRSRMARRGIVASCHRGIATSKRRQGEARRGGEATMVSPFLCFPLFYTTYGCKDSLQTSFFCDDRGVRASFCAPQLIPRDTCHLPPAADGHGFKPWKLPLAEMQGHLIISLNDMKTLLMNAAHVASAEKTSGVLSGTRSSKLDLMEAAIEYVMKCLFRESREVGN